MSSGCTEEGWITARSSKDPTASGFLASQASCEADFCIRKYFMARSYLTACFPSGLAAHVDYPRCQTPTSGLHLSDSPQSMLTVTEVDPNIGLGGKEKACLKLKRWKKEKWNPVCEEKASGEENMAVEWDQPDHSGLLPQMQIMPFPEYIPSLRT